MANFFTYVYLLYRSRHYYDQQQYCAFGAEFQNAFGLMMMLWPLGLGVGLTRDTSTLMVAQYFKRKREIVEMFLVAASGLGISIMSTFLYKATR